mgnify:CR=1 FL=1
MFSSVFTYNSSPVVDVHDSLVPQLDVRLGLETFDIHGRFHLI